MQTQIEELNDTLRTDLKNERAIVEQIKIDLYSYYLDGSTQFELQNGLTILEFNANLTELCTHTDEIHLTTLRAQVVPSTCDASLKQAGD